MIQRPATITVTAYLLYGAAALSVLGSVIDLSLVGETTDFVSRTEGGSGPGTRTIVLLGLVTGLAFTLLLAGVLAVLVIYNVRGRNGARVATWVLGALLVASSRFVPLGLASSPSDAATDEKFTASLPNWYPTISAEISILMLLTLLGAMVLLAVPRSNAYFRAVRAMRKGQWVPPPVPSQQPVWPAPPPVQEPHTTGIPATDPWEQS